MFENESGSSAAPVAAPNPNPEYYLRHDHPHLFFLQGYGGETYGYGRLRKLFKAWKARCDDPAPGVKCDLDKSPLALVQREHEGHRR